MRYHPALIAQAAATAAQLMPGRFMLGLGTGENLNEHVFGYRWPSGAVRLSMLEEAIGIIRMLWQDGWHSHHGEHYTIENARVYSLPDDNPPILLAAGAKRSAQAAGRLSDGLISTQPNPSTVEQFESAGGEGKPRFGQLTVCYARDEQEAVRTALEVWPNGAITGQASWELPLPRHFEQLGKLVSEDDVKESVVCGPNPDKHLSAIKEFTDAGFDHVFVHQIGRDQHGFFEFYREKIIPELKRTRASATAVHAPHAGNSA
jgi:G6PDH family F420-dependent oxidoreductase